MIGTFRASARDPKLSHAEALRQSMLAMIDAVKSDAEALHGFLRPGVAATISLSSYTAEFSYVSFRQLRTCHCRSLFGPDLRRLDRISFCLAHCKQTILPARRFWSTPPQISARRRMYFTRSPS